MSHADPETASLCSEGPSPSAGAAQPIFLPSEVAANRFRVVRLLGHGGMAQVFQAEDLELGQEVAIKVIRPELAPRRRAQELLRREVLLARRVTHPNVCRTFDVFHHQPGPGIGTGPASADAGETAPPGMLLLVMELLRGETLARRLAAGGPLTPAEALPIVCQLADALDAAHRSQVVHGDFKSSNVILEPTCRGPRAVVTDFGLAQHASMTAACAGGTTAYMAPEQLERREVTPSSDIYALGIVIFEMVSGRRPLVGEMSGASTSLHFPRLASLPPRRPRLPPGWEAAIGRCLAPAIGDRPANAGEVAAALVASIAREPGAADGPVLPQPIQRRRERGRARILARSALVLGCLGLAAIDRARVDRAEAGPTSPARSGSAGVPGVPGGPGWPGSEAAEGAAAAARDLGAGGGGDEGSAAGDPGAVARQVLAVAPLVDRSARPAEPWLGAALSHRIASEIGGAGGGSGAEVLRAPVATLFADRRLPSGTQLVVGGSFAVAEEAAGRRLRIDLALAPAVKGAPLPSFHEAGQLTEAADLASRLAVRLRRAIGVADPLPEDRAAMLASRPATLEAEGLLAAGVAQLERGEAVAARVLLGRALAADGAFPLTHAALARASVELGDRQRARQEAAVAAQQPVRLPEQQRLEIAAVAKRANDDLAGAEGILRALWRFAPHHPDYGLQLAESQLAAGEAAAAVETVRALGGSGLGDELGARADLVVARARQMQGELGASLAAALSAATRARQAGAVSLLAAARLAEADARAEDGDAAPASAALAAARESYRRLGFRAGEGEVRYRLAELAARAGRRRQALELDEEALAIFEATACARGVALANMAIGRYWHGRQDLQRAGSLFAQALAAFRGLGDRANEAMALNSLSLVAFDHGDLGKAEKLLEDEVGVDSGIGDRKGLSRALINLANYEGLRGDFHAARQHVEEALRLAHGLRYKTREAFAHQNLGALLFAERDLHGAGVELWRAAGFARQVNFPYVQRPALAALSVVLLEECRFRLAEDALGQALALASERGDPANEEALVDLARLELWEGEVATAEHTIRQAQAMRPETAPAPGPLAVLAWVLAARGDLAAARIAAERARRAESATTDIENRLLVAIGGARVALASDDPAAAAQGLAVALRRNALSARPDLLYEARLLRDDALLGGDRGAGNAGAGGGSGSGAAAVADLRALVEEARRLRFELIAREAERLLARAGGAGVVVVARHG